VVLGRNDFVAAKEGYNMKKQFTAFLIGFSVIVCGVTHAQNPKRRSVDVDKRFSHKCKGSIGLFAVHLIPSSGKEAGVFELYIIPAAVEKGDIASIVIANEKLEYKQLVSQVVLEDDKEIFAGYVNSSDLNKFENLRIVTSDPERDFLNAIHQKDAICQLPKVRNPSKKVEEKGKFDEQASTAKEKALNWGIYGFTRCVGPFGTFDLYVTPVEGKGSRLYEVTIVPVTFDEKKGFADIVVANENLSYKQLSSKVKLERDKEYSAGYLSESELRQYDVLSLAPHQNAYFLLASADMANHCEIPAIRVRSVDVAGQRSKNKGNGKPAHGSVRKS
jgi:hypothetical protein